MKNVGKIKIALAAVFTFCAITNNNQALGIAHPGDIGMYLSKTAARAVLEVPVAYALTWLTTLLHELGHTATYYAFTGDKVSVVVGGMEDDLSLHRPLVETPWFNLYAGSWSYLGGFMRGSLEKLNYMKKILILLAGPISGMLVSLGLDALLSKFSLNTFILRLLATLNFFCELLNLSTLLSSKNSDGNRIYSILSEKLGTSELPDVALALCALCCFLPKSVLARFLPIGLYSK